MELNKRNSNFNTNIELLKYLVNRESPDICFFTESNSTKEDNLSSSFKDYEIFHKPENNHPLDRIVAIIKKNKFQYQHMNNINDNNIASLWFKAKLSNRKYVAIGGYYRQWKLPQECYRNSL